MQHHRTAALLSLFALTGAVVPKATASQGGKAPAGREVRDLGALVDPLRREGGIPGLAAAIVTSEGLVARAACGVRALGHEERVTFEDRFHLGSCTKAMTATLVGVLQEEEEAKRRVSFDTTVGDVFGKDLGERLHGDWKDVPLSLLLRNRGGAPHSLDAGGLWRRLWTHRGTAVEQRRTLLEGVVTAPPASKPGTKYEYSNAGFAIAGHAVETLMGRSWEDLMRERVFGPLGMTSAGFGAPGSRDTIDEPRGHRANGSPVAPGPGSDNPVAIGPAGTVHASVGDWAKFVREHLRGAMGRDGLVKAGTFRRLHEPLGEGSERYAMGWQLARRTWAGGDVLTHSGSNTMWYCVTWIAPKRDLAVLVAGNRMGEDQQRATDAICWALIQDQLNRK